MWIFSAVTSSTLSSIVCGVTCLSLLLRPMRSKQNDTINPNKLKVVITIATSMSYVSGCVSSLLFSIEIFFATPELVQYCCNCQLSNILIKLCHIAKSFPNPTWRVFYLSSDAISCLWLLFVYLCWFHQPLHEQTKIKLASKDLFSITLLHSESYQILWTLLWLILSIGWHVKSHNLGV